MNIQRRSLKSIVSLTLAALIAPALLSVAASGQNITRLEREGAKDMLKAVKAEIKSKYYDPTFRGIDLDARFQAAQDKIDKATSNNQALAIVAQAVLDLNDSHTIFYPPARTARVEYGWRMKMVGDKAFITAVKPRSDAEKVGLKIGDEVLAIENFRPNRKEQWKVNYYYYGLSPRRGLKLIVRTPGSPEIRELNIASEVKIEKAQLTFEDMIRDYEINSGSGGTEHRFVKTGNTIIWQMPNFQLEPSEIDSIMRGRVAGSSNLVLDLRGNGGGYVVALETLAGYFVDKDTKIADLKGRKEMKPQMAKFQGKNAYNGRVVVLIDSESGSAAEIFARFIQLQKRGTVFGDQSSGSVMQSKVVPMQLGADSIVPYGMSVTNADVIMSDGASLERVGVTPDTPMIPTGADIAGFRDPVMSAALKSLGADVPPEITGKYFPFKWEK